MKKKHCGIEERELKKSLVADFNRAKQTCPDRFRDLNNSGLCYWSLQYRYRTRNSILHYCIPASR